MNRSKEHEHNPSAIISRKPISFYRLLQGTIPEQPSLNHEGQGFYAEYRNRLLFPFLFQSDTGNIITALAEPIRGGDLQKLFHLAAPSKTFGVDYRDTQTDWHDIFTNNPKRLEAHRRIPGWDIIEPHLEPLRQFIASDSQNDAPRITPVVQLEVENDGTISWKLDEIDSKVTKALPPEYTIHSLYPQLGPLLIAAFSPEITESWGKRLNYQLKNKGETNDMGSTQAFALTVAKADTLRESPLLTHLIQYARTGRVIL